MPHSRASVACILLLLHGPLCCDALRSSCYADDLMALVQSPSSRVHRTSPRLDIAVGSRYNLSGLPSGVHCEDVPGACLPPFNCNQHTAVTMYAQITKTTDGHANYNAWCHTQYLDFALHCQRRNFPEASVSLSRTRKRDPRLLEMDGQYCFAAGHCDNTNITKDTTVEQTEKMCDQIFGHEVWANKGLLDLFKAKARGKRRDNEYAQLACAMGNFQCDVLYCKETICGDAHWKGKYGHLASPDATPPTLLDLVRKRP
mmetsp:Transcript_96036/g.299063  ORF Transcript_96036/g.299063 Transcript_96036/m.299063 type:complete len:258 (-) Transcript_96036:88-861(-)